MGKERVITQESFDRLLRWLDPDRERAGAKYETIRRRLVAIFTSRGCHEAEDLADETINRVTAKVHEIAEGYTGEPALYFYGVASRVHLEYLRRPAPKPPPVPRPTAEVELEHECFEHCIGRLPAAQRELVLRYYRGVKRAKIDHRKQLAEELGIALNALRIRAHRIRAALQKCVRDCLAERSK
jgi:DNA-directed RNA polymerase specialized sigma24 family protein